MDNKSGKTNRDKILYCVKENPGLHLREIHRRLGIPLSTVEYHINVLLSDERIWAWEDGRYTRFYTGFVKLGTHRMISCLRKPRTREILSILLNCKYASFKDLSECMNIHDSTISYHLKNLISVDIIHREKVGKNIIYQLKDPAEVAEILEQLRDSF